MNGMGDYAENLSSVVEEIQRDAIDSAVKILSDELQLRHDYAAGRHCTPTPLDRLIDAIRGIAAPRVEVSK